MHYGDSEQSKSNILEVVVYLHANNWDVDKNKQLKDELRVCSIQECKFIRPHLLMKFLRNPRKYISGLLLPEEWYRVRLKEIDWLELEVLEIENVSESDNEFYRLH